MRFVDFLVSKIVEGFNAIGKLIYNLFSFLAPVLGFLWELLQAIGYFVVQLALVIWGVIKLFTALLQFFGAIVLGFFRTIFGFLVIDYDAHAINYPSESMRGMSYVAEWLNVGGWLNVLPLVILAVIWILFAVAVFRLFSAGGG